MRDQRTCPHRRWVFHCWLDEVQRGMKEDGNLGYDHRRASYRCEDCGAEDQRMVRV